MTDINQAMEAEQTRLTELLENIKERRIALDQEEKSAKAELNAIRAYIDTKIKGVQVRAEKKTRGPRKAGVRQQIIDTISAHPQGISRQELLAKLEATENKSLQQAISNALVALKKDNKVGGERGVYKPILQAS